MKKFVAILLSLCLMAGLCTAFADSTADYAAELPVMDLICAASMYSANSCESVPGEEGVLSPSFTNAFILVGQYQSPEVGVSSAMLNDTNAQAELLSSIFAADLPALEAVPVTNNEEISFIGFWPKTVTSLENGDVQLIGEIYFADRPLSQLSAADFASVAWRERGIFTLRSDDTAFNGLRVMGFAVGSDLDYEEEFAHYSDEISVEYVSSKGFTVLYPSVFTDELLVEDENGVSAELANGEAHFSAKCVPNTNGYTLQSYMDTLANGISGSIVNVDEEMQNGTLYYFTDDGQVVFDVIYVTGDYIYQAELGYPAAELAEYSMFNAYLENSFVVDELSLG